MGQLGSLLFGAALAVATMLIAGRLLLRALGIRCCRGEEDALGFVAGGACLSLIVFVLCCLRVAAAPAFLLVSGGLFVLGWRRGALRSAEPQLPALPRLHRFFYWSISAVFILWYLVNAMAPEMSPDGSTYHLGLVAGYLRDGGFRPITTNFYSSFPQGVEMLYLFAFAFGRHSSAALIHVAFTVALALMIVFYGRRFAIAPAGVCASLLVLASPVVGKDGASAYVDVAVACIGFAAFYALEMWREQRSAGLLAVAGICAGFAFASKYTAGVAFAYAVLAVAAARAKPMVRALAIVPACALIMTAPWLVKNWIVVDNPVSPFFNELFPNAHVQPSFERAYRAHFRRYGVTNLAEIPLEITVKGTALSGMLGPVFLLAPVALLAARSALGRRVLVAAIVFALPYAANISTRFLIPCLPFVSLALCLAATQIRALGPVLVLVHAISAFPPLIRWYGGPHPWIIESFPLRATLRLESEEDYLSRKFPGYRIARMIEGTVPAGAAVFTFGDVAYAYTSRDIRVAYQSASNLVLADILWTPMVPRFQPVTSVVFRFPEARIGGLRIVQLSGIAREWTVAEVKLDGSPRYLKITSDPNPWEAALAFDGSPVTRWRTLEAAAPGMFLQADLETPALLSRVQVDCANAVENSHDLKLLGRDSEGTWRELSAQPQIIPTMPDDGWKRESIRQMKQRGIGYMLVFPSDLFASDYSENIGRWGLTLAGEADGAKLFRLN